MKPKFKVGDMVHIVTDEAYKAGVPAPPGMVFQIGLVEIIDGEPVYYLYGGDDWGFGEKDIESTN